MSDEPVRRRDWLATAAFGMAGVGGLFALWPFVAALGPAADTRARRVTFDTKLLDGTKRVLLAVENRPIAVFRRSGDELASLRAAWDSANAPGGQPFRSASPRDPALAMNWHRSLRPDIMIFDAMCTWGDCVLSEMERSVGKALCPCCGTRYDLAGRVLAGPAPHNLRVPPHRFVDETTIEFTVADVMATLA